MRSKVDRCYTFGRGFPGIFYKKLISIHLVYLESWDLVKEQKVSNCHLLLFAARTSRGCSNYRFGSIAHSQNQSAIVYFHSLIHVPHDYFIRGTGFEG